MGQHNQAAPAILWDVRCITDIGNPLELTSKKPHSMSSLLPHGFQSMSALLGGNVYSRQLSYLYTFQWIRGPTHRDSLYVYDETRHDEHCECWSTSHPSARCFWGIWERERMIGKICERHFIGHQVVANNNECSTRTTNIMVGDNQCLVGTLILPKWMSLCGFFIIGLIRWSECGVLMSSRLPLGVRGQCYSVLKWGASKVTVIPKYRYCPTYAWAVLFQAPGDN